MNRRRLLTEQMSSRGNSSYGNVPLSNRPISMFASMGFNGPPAVVPGRPLASSRQSVAPDSGSKVSDSNKLRLKPRDSGVQCPRGHSLKFLDESPYEYGVINCGRCKMTTPPNQTVHCSICKYDLCCTCQEILKCGESVRVMTRRLFQFPFEKPYKFDHLGSVWNNNDVQSFSTMLNKTTVNDVSETLLKQTLLKAYNLRTAVVDSSEILDALGSIQLDDNERQGVLICRLCISILPVPSAASIIKALRLMPHA
eukprot:PhF_6_TR25762/c1_g1_i3/m.36331